MQILYHDEYFVAVNKPAGLLVHRSRIDKHETRFALQIVRDAIGRRVYPVHRLDKPTSGILLFALQPDAAAAMMSLFEAAQVEKTYVAVVRGYTDEHGEIDYPLQERLDKMTDALADQNKPAKPAVTRYRRLAAIELPISVGRYQTSRYSLLQATPLAGRKHQIRRHMKHIFHPIIGDTTYGDGVHNKMFREQFACHRLLLHAQSLAFPHPYLNRPVNISAPLDNDFEHICRRFSWNVCIQ
ncbi:MAG: tRNA pseudouridine(65) synthase TruC [Gammaproteobacteria bacterium]|jgi:tRNA pseudouridine65 synthase